MTYAELVKRPKPHFENCNNNPEETHVQGDYNTFCTPVAQGGLNIKNIDDHASYSAFYTYIQEKIWMLAHFRLINRMAWQWAEALVEIGVTLADIRGTTK